MRQFGLVAMAAVSLLIAGATAQAQTLGAGFSDVRQRYADAQLVRIGDARALELRDVDYGGFHWRAVDFVFSRTGHLDHLTMTSDAAYEDVLRVTAAHLAEPPSVSATAAPGGPEMQVRVCEQRGGGVIVTYEAAASLS